MQALGLIETKGLLAAIEGADAMVKAADVSILEKAKVGGGLITVTITGDVGAVKASIDAGVAAINYLDDKALISSHVIPRPHDELASIIETQSVVEKIKQAQKAEDNHEDNKDDNSTEVVTEETITEEVVEEATEEPIVEETIEEETVETTEEASIENIDPNNLHKALVDKLVSNEGLEKVLDILNKVKVVKLRNLAREYKDLGIGGRAISKADKNLLMTKFKMYYEKL